MYYIIIINIIMINFSVDLKILSTTYIPKLKIKKKDYICYVTKLY
jgi:hypothetical protein